MHRDQEPDRHAKTKDPPGHREDGHIHVVQHEHLVAQHRDSIEVLGDLLMRDRYDARLQPGDVRFERDRHLVAESALDARADRAQEPRPRCRQAKGDRR